MAMRNAIYKTLYDARNKLRARLVATATWRPMNPLEGFLRTDPRDAGCAETRRLLHVYVDELLAGEDPEAYRPGIAAHLRACPPCADERDGLLASMAVR